MKLTLKLEELGLLFLFSLVYFYYFQGTWGLYLGLFFVPDLSFALFLISPKVGAIAYNVFHHKGVMAMLMLLGYFLQNDVLIKVGLIFMAHSCFDRVAGYGLKYLDSFDHTHLGWVGKSKHKNE
ncbi:DUF4260 domain-containing protein [Haliscomenobacter hydrossis]|uniref:DUF4260 domain-containing protein n=1 Tax=Haliscomenobacter hydrossis (strain ATCC 27775 / DSM 1100 / LMG 10767 / O) TaxID=760192 RepID=F4L560_HALH1|nr:DUF4260 domain-containing protein [Haliscomenobacter hydrossis]AEE48781.1 hypothetical protein Halhy_0877 [Haliscomenobacter hydrossis DSM 1100]